LAQALNQTQSQNQTQAQAQPQPQPQTHIPSPDDEFSFEQGPIDTKIYPITYYTKVDVSNQTVLDAYASIIPLVNSYFKARKRTVHAMQAPKEAWRYSVIFRGNIGWLFHLYAHE